MRARPALALALLIAVASAAGAEPYLRKPKHGLQMQTAPFPVAAGADKEWCEYRRVPIEKPMDVGGFEVRMPPGAHHFVIWGYGGSEQDDSKFPQEPIESVACTGLAPDDLFPHVVVPIQTPNSRFRFPKGVALQLRPREQLWLNSHLKNFGTDTIVPDIRFNFYAVPKRTVKHHAEGMIVGNMGAIAVPPGGDQTITAEWTAPANVNLVFLTTHQHRLGTYANIELVETDGTPTKLMESTNWEHPINFWPRPIIRLEQGRKLRITCRWHNTDDHVVHFGPKTTDEMCFILGFYYRDKGDDAPIRGGGCLSSTSGLVCPLAPAIADSNPG